MRRFSEFPGMPVLLSDGKSAGQVEEGVYTSGAPCLDGLVIRRSGLRGHAFVALQDIALLGAHAIILSPYVCLQKPPRVTTSAMRAFASDGQEMGKITDMLIDGRTGTIQGFELSRGIWEDLRVGREMLWVNDQKRR